MLPKYIPDAEERAGSLLTNSTLVAMNSGQSDEEEDEYDNNNDVESIDKDSGNVDAQSVNSDDDSNVEQHALM
jgi:hypothetical protein